MTIKGINLNEYYLVFAKFCPECGKELEVHPNTGWKCCFLHGDLNIANGEIVWRYTKYLIERAK